MTNYWMWIYYNKENIHELYRYLASDIKNITLQKKESDNNKIIIYGLKKEEVNKID